MPLEVLESAPDVVAVRIEGKLEHESLQRVIDMIENSISGHEKTHMFVEAAGFSGLEVKHMLEYFRRGLPLLGKLKRFGRVAIVTDQAWLRGRPMALAGIAQVGQPIRCTHSARQSGASNGLAK